MGSSPMQCTKFRRYMRKIFLALALVFLTSCSSLRLTTIHYSYHNDRNIEYNELHNGLGVEWEFSEGWYIGATHYVNNQIGLSNAITLVKEYEVSENWDIGFMIRAADGYKEIDESTGRLGLEDKNQVLGGLLIQRIPFRLVIAPSATVFGLVVEF